MSVRSGPPSIASLPTTPTQFYSYRHIRDCVSFVQPLLEAGQHPQVKPHAYAYWHQLKSIATLHIHLFLPMTTDLYLLTLLSTPHEVAGLEASKGHRSFCNCIRPLQ